MVRLAINGMGRIGRCVLRAAQETDDITVEAINDRHAPDDIAYHYNHDTVHGSPQEQARVTEDGLNVGGNEIKAYQTDDPADIPWDRHDLDLVLEATGVFRHKKDAAKHLDAGAEKVLLSAPAKGEQADTIPSIVYGVNNDVYDGESIVDCASCTTNSLAPMAKALHDAFGIESGLLTTVHAYAGS
ncbi:MAG: type I glyceraldehyde-3-phosphate dehydrogenase, partial [Candidatus Nanohaloarchaeota archaeon QJJ-5]|nr:type I glyceraldehyde-3-phosphate dehydrogenase [Candidatus Nanohaloarchaeota archaeon QJJ-5]